MTRDDIKRAIIHGSVVASYTVEDFGMERLRTLNMDDVLARYRDFKDLTNFEPTCPWSDKCAHIKAK